MQNSWTTSEADVVGLICNFRLQVGCDRPVSYAAQTCVTTTVVIVKHQIFVYKVHKLTSIIPGAGTGTSDSLFIVGSQNPSSSTLFTSLALCENELNVPCQHENIVKVESIDVTTSHSLYYYCTIDKLTL